MNFQEVIGFLKLSPKVYGAICLFSVIFLVLPVSVLERYGVNEIYTNFKWVIFIAFCISMSFLLVEFISPFINFTQNEIKDYVFIKSKRELLKHLSEEEKEFLNYYVENNTKTQYCQYGDGVPSGLAAANIIFRASNVAIEGRTFAYNIQPWAWKCLQMNPDLLT